MNQKLLYRTIENFCHFNHIDLYHETIKALCLGDKHPETNSENYVSFLRDGLLYVENNLHHDVNLLFLQRLYFLISNQVLENDVAQKIMAAYCLYQNNHPLEQASQLLYEIMKMPFKNNLEVGFMLVNYILMKNHLGTFLFHESLFESFTFALTCDNYMPLLQFIMSSRHGKKEPLIVNKNKTTLKEIAATIMSVRKELETRFSVKHLLIYGSYAKNNHHIDSDVDILVNFKDSTAFFFQNKLRAELKNYLYDLLKINVDIINLEIAIAEFKNMRLNEAVKIF